VTVISVFLGNWRAVSDKEVLPQGWFERTISSACGYTVLLLHQVADVIDREWRKRCRQYVLSYKL
jgi:hypothetical protein